MDNNNQDMTLQDIREMDLVDYLSNLGHEPAKIRNRDFWYLSPLRSENTPSFKVNRNINRWYDFGLGKGGNLIDFAILYQGCSIAEFLAGFRQNPMQLHKSTRLYPPKSYTPENKLQIIENRSLRSDQLLSYLQDRRISIHVADEYCREVSYGIGDRTFDGIGFQNDSAGFEIRSPCYKLSSSPKDITTKGTGNSKVAVFEGFMDFLTFRTLHRELEGEPRDFLILNSLSFFERARPQLEEHQEISLYLDRDSAGLDATHYALSLSEKYRDESTLYKNHKDLNEWAMHIGKTHLHIPARRISK